jgi:hypothetical protein
MHQLGSRSKYGMGQITGPLLEEVEPAPALLMGWEPEPQFPNTRL